MYDYISLINNKMMNIKLFLSNLNLDKSELFFTSQNSLTFSSLHTGKLASTDKENVNIMAPHLEKVFIAQHPITWDALDNDIEQCKNMEELNGKIQWKELLAAVKKLANDKSPGLNNVPPGTFKALSHQNLDTLYSYLNAYWREEVDFTKWHEGQIVSIPKSGNVSDLDKWQGVTL